MSSLRRRDTLGTEWRSVQGTILPQELEPHILKVRTLPGRGPHAPRIGGPPGSPGGPHLCYPLGRCGDLQPGRLSIPRSGSGPPPLAFLSPKNPPPSLEPVVAATHLDRKGPPVTRASSPPSPGPQTLYCPTLLHPVLFDMPVLVTETIWANPLADLGLPRHKVCTWHELRVSFARSTCSGFPYCPQWKSFWVHGFQDFQRAIQEVTKAPNMPLLNPMCPQPQPSQENEHLPPVYTPSPHQGDRRAWDRFPTHHPVTDPWPSDTGFDNGDKPPPHLFSSSQPSPSDIMDRGCPSSVKKFSRVVVRPRRVTHVPGGRHMDAIWML